VPWYRPLARYDTSVLRPLPVASAVAPQRGLADHTPGLAAAHASAQKALNNWCHAGAGPACVAWWRPWAAAQIDQCLSVALWTGPGAAALWPAVQDFCTELDGSQRLLALPSRWAGRVWRLRIKLFECAWWRSAPAQLPWDAGQLLADEAVLARLARFQPRRATLVVAQGLTFDQIDQVLRHLQNGSPGYAHAVRLLLVSASNDATDTTDTTDTTIWRAWAQTVVLPIQVLDWPLAVL
jgi:hypothetical protein